ncbi:hypothetical protein BS50DRAFT_620404 [Corynespora cassiicola Philippines]|uniref:Zn(2)-C6 fungal-type domain-containing protein n=1 Tax=Corynespora cassiicola Philippines TaxID=1448308 RepID=A0A2T2NSA8_CORCC|nr:hypothetical protein BS50DRAFT_620404 [Corynespora cassiicola Philippines]
MVGVPGRSKACSTCKLRRKKCDLQVPECGNCLKVQRECGGYERSMIVIHVGSDGKGQYKPQASKSRRVPQIGKVEISLADFRMKDLQRSAFELACLETFWVLYLPKPACLSQVQGSTSDSLKTWVTHTNHYLPQSDALRCAMLAIGASKVGEAKGDRSLVERGIELYGSALMQLASQLQTKDYSKRFGLLATCRLLALYEQSNGASSAERSWCKHIDGLLTFIQFYPPGIFSLPGKHEVFLEARYNGIVSATTNHRSTFLSGPPWTTAPWQNGLEKTSTDTALDLLAQLPSILEELDALTSLTPSGPDTPERATQLKTRCWTLDTDLQLWALDPSNADPVSEDSSPSVHAPDGFPTPSLPGLHARTLYQTTTLLLSSALLELHTLFPSPDTSANAALFASLTANMARCCTAIAGAAAHFQHPDAGLAARMSIAFPLECVARVLAEGRIRSVEGFGRVGRLVEDGGTDGEMGIDGLI